MVLNFWNFQIIKKKVFGVGFGIITFLHSIKHLAMGFMEIKPQLGSTYLNNAYCWRNYPKCY